jgi:hypothetical protein
MILDRVGPGATSAVQGLPLEWIKVLVRLVGLARVGAVFEAGKLVKQPDESQSNPRQPKDLHPQVLATAPRDAIQPA